MKAEDLPDFRPRAGGAPTASARGPLAGLRVIELTGLAPAPYAGMLLADLGADVLRVDRPGQSTSPASAGMVLLRNRPSIGLDLKSADDVAIFLRLVDRADVLIEGFRPGVIERLGVGPEPCLRRNAGLVYGRVTGWGQDGPLARAAGHDLNYIALAGALHHFGDETRPPTIPLNIIGDHAGGGLLLAFGVLAALHERSRSGRGQVVDAAMVDGSVSLQAGLFQHLALGLMTEAPASNPMAGHAPFYGVYRTSDERFVTVAAAEPQFYRQFLDGLGLDSETIVPAQFDASTWPRVRGLVADVISTRTQAEWCARFEGTDCCLAPVLSPVEAAAHPHNQHRQTFLEIDGHLQGAPVPRFNRTPSREPVSFPTAQADVDSVLESWGLPTDVRQRVG
jgi:alpha-methylacyl-CoA racemase